jgi:hypothetical protein
MWLFTTNQLFRTTNHMLPDIACALLCIAEPPRKPLFAQQFSYGS